MACGILLFVIFVVFSQLDSDTSYKLVLGQGWANIWKILYTWKNMNKPFFDFNQIFMCEKSLNRFFLEANSFWNEILHIFDTSYFRKLLFLLTIWVLQFFLFWTKNMNFVVPNTPYSNFYFFTIWKVFHILFTFWHSIPVYKGRINFTFIP